MFATAALIGLDFSGGVDAGRKIWLSIGRTDEGGRYVVERCLPAVELPGSAAERNAAIGAVRRLLRELTPDGATTIVGCDFPPSLPLMLIPGGDWRAFVEDFPRRFPNESTFRAECTRLSGGREVKRRTDRETKTPFCAYNLRMYRQTYFGIRDLLRPLVREAGARVMPMQPPQTRGLNLIEVCPASTLKRLGLYRPYKGKTDAHRRMRQSILSVLRKGARLSYSPAIARRIASDAEGDALDSVIALLVTARAAAGGLACPGGPEYHVEGYVFA
ncbi:MAG: DUF429 domain-containing protein [Phycisphaerae bacterium]